MKVCLEDKEPIAMMLQQHINSGWATPQARATLTKLERSTAKTVDLNSRDLEAILDVYSDITKDYYWFPRDSSKSVKSRHRELYGPTPYLTEAEVLREGLE